MQRYVKKLEEELAEKFEDVYIEKYRIIKGTHLKQLFLEEFMYMPVEKRLARIKLVLQTEVKRKRKVLLVKLTEKYNEALDKALYGIQDDEKRRTKLTRILEERDTRLPAIEKAGKSAVSAYMRRFNKIDIKKLYRNWLTNRQLQNELAFHWSTEERDAFFNCTSKGSMGSWRAWLHYIIYMQR